MAVLAAGVKTVKMGADTVLAVAGLVPILHLKDKMSVRPRPRPRCCCCCCRRGGRCRRRRR
jgi:hypothetical protein